MNRRDILKYGASLPILATPDWVHADQMTTNGNRIPAGDTMKIQRLAWAGIKIVVGSTTVFVDATSYPNQHDQPLAADTEFIHALITHHHSDHYDPAALKSIFLSNSQLVCHEDAVPWLGLTGLNTQAVKLFEPIALARWTGDITALPVPAVDGFGHPQVSWVIIGGGKKIIHCGDTLWHGYWHLISAYGPFDLAFMPINGARMRQGRIYDTGMPAVLTPDQAIIAAKLLNAKSVCPIHYGRPGENYFETPDPEGNFLKAAARHTIPTILMQQGEWI